MTLTKEQDRILGSFFGGIVGDAYGAVHEFKERDTYEISPNMERTVYNMPPGSFTDDSSMMLCLAASLLEKKRFDVRDQLEKYLAWRTTGYMSSDPEKGCFDIGRTTSMAISEFAYMLQEESRSGKPVDLTDWKGLDGPMNSGNGSLMRLCPVPILCRNDRAKANYYSMLSSRVTHASKECLESAILMSDIIVSLLKGASKDDVPRNELCGSFECPKVNGIACKEFLTKTRDEIQTTGYVIHTLEAALWAFMKTSSFEEGVYLLAKMGKDVDTCCCVYGQIAGAFYGYSSIPQRWLDSLQRKSLLADIGTQLMSTILEG